ncbi:hypothetical protein G5714_007507 [Onychostoma macrolepis]|uniref:Uncharacterized protein n=1 Tax=Onychostoma macrolepis TaxID=369639 RepID=A0A7J6CT39_9TELE|nr:hypothetical protein G5714_007507 [Onychostoma macrolepis]
MQVLWHFRKDLRCVRVIASKLDTKELSKQVVDLFLLSSEEQGQKTVLLLLDIQENTNDNLQIKNSLRKNLNEEIHQRDITTNTPVVIIFNCSSAYCLTTAEATADVKLKMELSPHEKQRFEQKKKELKKKHKETSQEFHAFNIMQGGFKKEDAEKVITEEMINHVKNHKESSSTRLLSFLALINSYVPGSHLSKLFCQEFMDQTEQPTDEEKPTLETIMKPFMDLIVIFSKEEQEANCIRLAHPMIADACLKLFTESKLTRFDIAKDFLNSLVKGKESNYVRICNNMLVRRLQTEQGKQTFSRLILDIINERENNANQCICLLELASDLFSTDPVYPQTLARLFYIKVKEDNKYEEARKWATLAIKRDPKNSHIRDTLGQVHKNHLLNETKKQHSDINMYLAIAQSAIKAFKDEEEAAEGESEDDTGFSNRGLFGFLQSGEPCEKAEDLQARLQELWATEAEGRRPEFYLLMLLLFWPEEAQPAIANPPDLEKCVQNMNQSYKNKYQKYLRSRYLVPLFFFGNGNGLQRLIHSSKLDEMYLELLSEGHEKAEVECLQRISGKVEDDKVFVVIKAQQIQVTPHNRASVCKPGLVSFYLGFNIRGPVAYNIRYEDNFK